MVFESNLKPTYLVACNQTDEICFQNLCFVLQVTKKNLMEIGKKLLVQIEKADSQSKNAMII